MSLSDLGAQALAKVQQLAERGSSELHYLQKMISAGAFGLEPPQSLAAMVADLRRWGEVGMIPALNARRTPHRPAIIDDDGSMTFAELDNAVNAAANGLLAMGVTGGDGVAILARNHRWFLIANYACARVGARTILLNTEFSGPQIRDVAEREGARVIIYDDEYADAVTMANPEIGVGHHDDHIGSGIGVFRGFCHGDPSSRAASPASMSSDFLVMILPTILPTDAAFRRASGPEPARTVLVRVTSVRPDPPGTSVQRLVSRPSRVGSPSMRYSRTAGGVISMIRSTRVLRPTCTRRVVPGPGLPEPCSSRQEWSTVGAQELIEPKSASTSQTASGEAATVRVRLTDVTAPEAATGPE